MIFKNIRPLISLPWVYFLLLKYLYKQKKFIRHNILKELDFNGTSGNGITKTDIKKITRYYALGVPAILGESLAVLRSKPLTVSERYCLTYLGGISGLLDDLFDNPLKKVHHLEEFIFYPKKMKPSNSQEELLLNMYQKGLSFASHPVELKSQALKVFKAQQQSLEQQKKEISEEILSKLTLKKGGFSFNYYRLCLEKLPGKEEEELLFQLGGLMQMGNDIFDVWEDFRDGTQTLATRCTNIASLRETFKKKFDHCHNIAHSTPYPKTQITKFFNIITLSIARVFVCLDQFEMLQKSSGNNFQIKDYSREHLICDMQGPSNQIKAVKYYLKYSR